MPSALGRLKQRREFLWVAAANRKWVTPGLILQARAVDPARPPLQSARGCTEGEAGPPGIRVGFTVSRKVGNAVARNRARRRLRAAAHEVLPDHAKETQDYVVIGRRQTLDRPYGALVRDMISALQHLDAYRDGPEHIDAKDKIKA